MMMDRYVTYGLLIAALMAGVISLYASSDPDGLEWVAETLFEKGYWSAEDENVIDSPMPNYIIPGIENKMLAASSAGLFGVSIMFLIVYGLGKILAKKK